MKDFSTDTFFNGKIKVKQNRSGYRFSIDAVLLAYHAGKCPGGRIIDLGTGCAIIPLIMAYRNPKLTVCGIEIQKELADIATINVKSNNMEKQITILCRDMKELNYDMISGPVDMVVSNPPYWKILSGKMNPDQQRAVARHEIKATLFDVIETAHRMLHTAGRIVMVYSSDRLTDIIAQMRSFNIEPKLLRTIHSNGKSGAKLILIEGIKGGRPGVTIASPLIIYHENGSYTNDVKQMFLPSKS
ncbi:MAG: tRNA1(Val) (adenine(37)-N6)-methyltransferase [Desulfobacteraceae bacterium]|nr:tRNA1(Val) (adenine(37)-N6)-methyltransferase [Desulfobacteraceae bacterium]MBC2718342.1 tRNA1(Val) (adenine(37)-N6)-methyltransferase [Desulfobacteraceae bacterium]